MKEIQYRYMKKVRKICNKEIREYELLRIALFKADRDMKILMTKLQNARTLAMQKAMTCLTWDEHKEIISSLDERLEGANEIRSMPELFKSCITPKV